MRKRIAAALTIGTLGLGSILLPASHVGAESDFPWDQSGRDAGHTYASPGPSPTLPEVQWQSSVGGLSYASAVDDGQVFATRAGGVLALDENTGALIRTYPVSNLRTLALAGNLLVVGDEAGTIRAFDISSGAEQWSRMTGPVPNVTVEGGRVFVNSSLGDGQIRALDLATGNILWSAGSGGNSSSPPTVVGNTVFQNAGAFPGVLALDATTGSEKWLASVSNVISSPVADATRLFVGTQAGHLVALDQTTGGVLWDTLLGGEIYAGGTANGLAFAQSFSGILYALNADTGAIDWELDTGTGMIPSTLASGEGRGFFSSQGSNPTLYALNLGTGSVLWTLPAGYVPIVADGQVFAQTDGDVIAIGPPLSSVPEPSTLLVLGSGLAGLGGMAWRRQGRR